ncbi:MAG: class I SAM-dependent methyltransferase family protein, partial [Methanobrevibacter sp.]|nr:class I SAM-dependent methyltransferase family protein [Candidatus Methanoflexus mossambicus]
EEIENLKTSFDIIGDIVILEIPEDLQKYKDIIGKAALEFTKRKAIFMKKGVIEGIIRTRQIECIAGENNSKTIHKEHGARLSLNIADVYFSPRLATERKRVASQVKNGEKILDMFAGIGPFPILIAKDKNVEIYAVDINESAINYMEENIKINKLKGKIYPFKGDMKEIAIKFNETNTKFDRIIMNLPGTASNFLDLAISLINENGIIHYYEFNDNYEEGIKKIKSIAKKYKRDIEVINTRKVKSSRPGEWHIAIDVKIH